MSPVAIAALVITAIAAFTDTRSGRIPNWLTLPVLVLAPAYHGFAGGTGPLIASLLGLVLCAALPFFMFVKNAMGGGDVKLFAALGALLHPYAGVEIQFYSYVAVAFLLLARMAWDGQLFATLLNVGRVFVNMFLPAARRLEIAPSSLNEMRMGLAIFVATAGLIAMQVTGNAL